MILTRFCLVFCLVILISNVSASHSDVFYLKEHFIANLIEENRGRSSDQLTDDIEFNINTKIQGFLETINPPSSRSRRDANDLLLNEKTQDISVLKGFESRGFIPINFPRDICMFKVNQEIFAAGWTRGRSNSQATKATFGVFHRQNGRFIRILMYESMYLEKIDCKSTQDAGFIVIVNSIKDSQVKNQVNLMNFGSFVYRVTIQPTGEPSIEIFQKFSLPNQNGARLWLRDSTLLLMFSYDTKPTSPLNACTVFELVETHFNPIDDLPCQNARVVEFFTVHHNLMVFIGNYQENNGTTNTFSTIMRYNLDQKRFLEYQKISTSALTVGKYFYLDHQEQRQHFLLIGNDFEINQFGVINYDIPSIIYKLVNGFFVPMQMISKKHVQAVVPMTGKNNEFHLLLACEDSEVQIFVYDGWKFQESPLDFTGDAFGAGVIGMKVYNDIIVDTPTLVISNQDSFEPTSNVYTPIYANRNDSTKLRSSISKWCSEAFERLDEFDVDDTDELLQSALDLADPNNQQATFRGRVVIRNSTISTINTKELKGTRVQFTNSTAQRFLALDDRVTKLATAVQHVTNKIRFTKATQRMRRQVPMLIKNLTISGQVNIETLNGRSVKDLVYKSNRKNSQLKSIVANEVLIKQKLFVNRKIDGIELSDDNVILNQPNQVLRPLTLVSLNANSVSNISNINGIPINEFFKLVTRKFSKKIPNNINQLTADSITIGRFLNNRNFTAMAINSLKTSGDQVITAPVKIGRLAADQVWIKHKKISNIPLSQLIDIKEKRRRQDISQDIRFTNDLTINQLQVLERINNINVKRNQLLVMRKSGPTKQIVTAEKFFDVVNLLTPIVLQGKIESKTLEKMNPIVTVNEDLELLQGDYKITGPVTIRRIINATGDITTLNSDYSLRRLSEKGLNLFSTTETANNFVFKNVVEVKQNLQATSLNQKTIGNFVKTNFTERQIVHGEITLNNGLKVHGGTVQADIINEVDLNQLNSTILKRFSVVTQFIDGNVEMASLTSDQLISSSVTLNGKDINLVLSTGRAQELEKLTVNKLTVKNLAASSFLQSEGGKMFGHDLNYLVDDIMTSTDSVCVEKKFSNLTVGHLKFADGNEWKSIINNYENSIAQELNFTGNLIFPKDVHIENLEVTGNINGVTVNDITNNWLRSEGDQTFTAQQNVKSIEVENSLIVTNGKINEIDIAKMFSESIWIDEAMFIENVVLQGKAIVKGQVLAPTVNGDDLNGKLVLNNTDEVQSIKKLSVDGNIFVEYLNSSTINGINCDDFMKIFSGNEGTENLLVIGNAIFQKQPEVTSLNNENLRQLYETVWIADRPVTLTGDNIKFLGGIRSDGELRSDFVNEKDISYYNQSYFSLTENQNIGSHFKINGSMFIKKALQVDRTAVTGLLKTHQNDKGLDIANFAENILRKGREQSINSSWSVAKLVIHGDYNGTMNGLKFSDDVLHHGNKASAEISGHKKFRYLSAHNVEAPSVNGIDVKEWLENAIFTNSEYSQEIVGKVQLGVSSFAGNLLVLGAVNEVSNFGYDTVLTKSSDGQVINGDLTIETMTPDQVKQLFIENLYLRRGINGKNLSELYQNVFKVSDNEINSKNIIFDQKLTVGSLRSNKNIFGVDLANLEEESKTGGKLVKFQHDLEYLSNVGDSLRSSEIDVAIELSHFELHQAISGVNIQKTVALVSGTPFLAVHERNFNTSMEIIKFYRWNRDQNQFVDDISISPLQYSMSSYQITKINKIVYKGVDHLFLEIFDRVSRKFFQSLLQFNAPSKTFAVVMTTESSHSAEFFTHNRGESNCYGHFMPLFTNLNIACEGIETAVIQTAAIRMVASHNGIVILLTDDLQLQVWNHQKLQDISPPVINPQGFSFVQHDGKLFLAVISDKVEQSIHHGSIEIYESRESNNFVHVQTIDLENPFQIQFSNIPSGDLLLYVLTKNPGKALNIFKYAGASYFVEFISSSTIVNMGTDLSTMSIDGKTEFLSVVAGDIFIIEAVLKEYS